MSFSHLAPNARRNFTALIITFALTGLFSGIALGGGITPAGAATVLPQASGKENATKESASKTKVATAKQRNTALLKANRSKANVAVTSANKRAAKVFAKRYLNSKYASNKKAAQQYTCLSKVFQYESGWNWKARASAGYYGLPQTKNSMAKHGKNWRTHYEPQIKWGHSYMTSRYGSPCGAWAKIQRSGWY